jgi:predicted membrane protein
MNLNFIKKNTSSGKSLVHKIRNPHFAWMLSLEFLFSFLFLLILLSFYFLYQIKNEKIFQSDNGDAALNILVSRNEKLMNQVKENSLYKENKLKEIKRGDYRISDPKR